MQEYHKQRTWVVYNDEPRDWAKACSEMQEFHKQHTWVVYNDEPRANAQFEMRTYPGCLACQLLMTTMYHFVLRSKVPSISANHQICEKVMNFHA